MLGGVVSRGRVVMCRMRVEGRLVRCSRRRRWSWEGRGMLSVWGVWEGARAIGWRVFRFKSGLGLVIDLEVWCLTSGSSGWAVG